MRARRERPPPPPPVPPFPRFHSLMSRCLPSPPPSNTKCYGMDLQTYVKAGNTWRHQKWRINLIAGAMQK
jgi:hypothetical protein